MKKYDIVGIGAGPANLSLAALLTKNSDIKALIIEKQKEFIWHSGMLIPDSKIQIPFLNDLVTLVDPTNEYSFLNFLVLHQRLYQFIAANFNFVLRKEFSQYLEWAFKTIPTIQSNEEVVKVSFNGNDLIVHTSKDQYTTKNLVLGTGQNPYIPEGFKKYLGKDIFHNTEYMHQKQDFKNKRIAVVGGGQSGAEIADNLLINHSNTSDKIYWISKRTNFLSLDDTPFTNEIFTPNYIHNFHAIEPLKKQQLNRDQALSTKGISRHTLENIYQKLYEHKFMDNKEDKFYLLPSHELIKITKDKAEYIISIKDLITENIKNLIVDKIIFCTGYDYQIPAFLSDIKSQFHHDYNGLKIDSSYKILWDGMDQSSIYMQNGATHTHGVSDPTLSIAAYRSATILNQIVNKPIYPNVHASSIINWGWYDAQS